MDVRAELADNGRTQLDVGRREKSRARPVRRGRSVGRCRAPGLSGRDRAHEQKRGSQQKLSKVHGSVLPGEGLGCPQVQRLISSNKPL